ncbi:MAG: SGNH/GDSL hydrolase family protein [Williamsia sp.]|nr:SGNH/GDSL hydrolase family protein [Williamsia sp.]
MQAHSDSSRRRFLRDASLAGLTFSIPSIVKAAYREEKAKKIALQPGDVVLFQGDSITDAGRKKDEKGSNNTAALGSGYAMLAGSELLLRHAGKNLQVYNKGISGNKVYQLAERWDADCLQLQPKVLSILIGVNDFWHTLTNGYKGTIETYRKDFTALLDRTKEKLPGVQLIIGEPFAVTGIKAVDDKWYPAFNDYREAARQIADKYDAVFIPYQKIFDKAQKSAPGAYWTGDGVHPTLAGAKLMAQAWLEAVKG